MLPGKRWSSATRARSGASDFSRCSRRRPPHGIDAGESARHASTGFGRGQIANGLLRAAHPDPVREIAARESLDLLVRGPVIRAQRLSCLRADRLFDDDAVVHVDESLPEPMEELRRQGCPDASLQRVLLTAEPTED